VFRWNDGEEAGARNGISGDDEVHGGLRDRVFLFYLVLSVYLSFRLFVILFPLVSTEELRVRGRFCI
jgi:hypothetical protein